MKHPWDLPPPRVCFLIHIHRALCLVKNIRWAFHFLFFRISHKNADQEWKSEATPHGQSFVSRTVCSFIWNKDTAGVHTADFEEETLNCTIYKKGRDQFNLVQLSADKLQEDTKFNCAMPSESADHPSHTQKMPSGHSFNYGEVNMSSISE